jgi:hypothetical protein
MFVFDSISTLIGKSAEQVANTQLIGTTLSQFSRTRSKEKPETEDPFKGYTASTDEKFIKRLQRAKGQEAIGQVLCEQHGLSWKDGTLHEWVKKTKLRLLFAF